MDSDYSFLGWSYLFCVPCENGAWCMERVFVWVNYHQVDLKNDGPGVSDAFFFSVSRTCNRRRDKVSPSKAFCHGRLQDDCHLALLPPPGQGRIVHVQQEPKGRGQGAEI